MMLGALMIAICAGAAPVAQAAYITTTIQLPGALATIGVGIDGSGRVLGYGYVDDGTGTSTIVRRGFLWQNGTTIAFSVPGSDTLPTAISNNGLVVGTAYDSQNVASGFVFNGASFAATGTYPTSVNDAGQIVGQYDDSGTPRGFVSDGTTFTPIDVPGGTNARANGINASGAIVGQYQQADSSYAGFSMVGGIIHPFFIPGATNAIPMAVNDSNQVIATAVDAGSGTPEAFLVSNLGVTPIIVPGGTEATPIAINNSGMIVGTYRDTNGDTRSFLDDNGVYSQIAVPGSTYTVANAINGSGQIAGIALDPNGGASAFFAQNIDISEPASWAVLAVSLALATYARRRRPS